MRTDPPVSDPMAMSTSPAATAAADPQEEPPGKRSGAAGLIGAPLAAILAASLGLPVSRGSGFARRSSLTSNGRSHLPFFFGATRPTGAAAAQELQHR